MLDDFMLFSKILGQTEQPFSVPLVAGTVARVFSVIVVNPIELIRTKMLSQKLSYYGTYAAYHATAL